MSLSVSESIIIGLLQGIPLVILVGIYYSVRSYRRKRYQKEYIRKIISTHIKRILDAKDTPDSNPKSERIYKANEIRKSHYDYMYEQVNAFLSHKATEFCYEEEKELRDAFYSINLLMSSYMVSNFYTFPSLETYEEKLIRKLKKIKWLRLQETNKSFSFGQK